MFKFFEDGLVGGDLHFFFGLVENDFLLDECDDVGEEVVKDESAGEVNHDEEEHDWHHGTHLSGSHVVDFGLVDFFAFASFFHKLTEAFALDLAGRTELFRGEVLNKAGGDSEEESEASTPRSEAWGGFKVDETEE